MSEDGSVLIVVELCRDSTIQPISLEGITGGRMLADEYGGKLFALILGSAVSEAAAALNLYGLDGVYVVDDPLLQIYQPELYVSAVNQVITKLAPRAVVMGQTLTAVDLAPRVAFSLNTGLITDCIGLEVENGEVQFIKPVYSSNIMAAYSLAEEPQMVTFRSGTYDPAEKQEGAAAETIPAEVVLDASIVKTAFVKSVVDEEEGPKLTASDIIISGGRGVGGPEGFKALAALAKILNAAVGASRPPCDLGWVAPKAQVGQTGEIVRPMVYIAVGISGATQHIAGMVGAKTIVAINKDSKANIFKIADYGVVGKYEEVFPAFKDALAELSR